MVRSLFAHYLAHPQDLPAEWAPAERTAAEAALARLVADYIAGMTDRYALREYERIFKERVFEE